VDRNLWKHRRLALDAEQDEVGHEQVDLVLGEVKFASCSYDISTELYDSSQRSSKTVAQACDLVLLLCHHALQLQIPRNL
jgi:hypothetical protein